MNRIGGTSEAAIFSRVMGPLSANLSRDAANSVLRITFPSIDRERMDELAEKARQGTLLPLEESELENYSRVGRLIEIMKSEARAALKSHTA